MLENAVLNALERPEKSIPFPSTLIQQKQIEMLIIGDKKLTKNCSIKVINNSIEALETAPLVMLPVIMYIMDIIGIKVFITVHKSFIKEVTLFKRFTVMANTDKATHNPEQSEKVLLIVSLVFSSIFSIEQIKTITIMEAKDFITSPNPKKM